MGTRSRGRWFRSRCVRARLGWSDKGVGGAFDGVDVAIVVPRCAALIAGAHHRGDGRRCGVTVSTTAIASTQDPNRGYLIVSVPASPRAPHTADGKYYGRGDKRNRILSHAEVLRLHERQIVGQRDVLAAAREKLSEVESHWAEDAPPMMVLLAQPIGAPDELLVPLTESPNWQQTVLEMIRAAAVPDHQQFSPSLLYGAALSFQALSYAMGSTFGFLRFYIVAVPSLQRWRCLRSPTEYYCPAGAAAGTHRQYRTRCRRPGCGVWPVSRWPSLSR